MSEMPTYTEENTLESRPETLINNTEFGKQAQIIDEEFQQATTLTNLKLNFLKESFTAITQADIKNVKSASEIWGLVETEIFGQKHTYSERKKYFTAKQDEIRAYAQENNKNATGLTEKYRGSENQNIILKAYIKNLLFGDTQKMNAVNDAIIDEHTFEDSPKNAFDIAVSKNYESESGNNETNETISLDEKVQKAVSRLESNINAKKIKVQKNAVKIISDIASKTMTIIMANGTIHTISPVVFSKKGTGTEPKSQKTPTGSFIIKSKQSRPLQRENNVTGYFMHLSGIEQGNANSYARGIGIHGMPTNDSTMENGGAFTYGCTGMTNENIQKLYNLIKGKQTFVETVK